MKNCFLPFFLLCLFLLNSCGEEKSTANDSSDGQLPAATPQNVIILLDLSNRIQKKGQVDKDKAVIQAALDEFAKNQLRFGYVNSKDKLMLAIAAQPDVEAVTNDALQINMRAREKNKVGKPLFDERRRGFEQELEDIYAQAVKSPFTGADIYSFFCSELPAKYLSGEAANKVIVITDGYLLFDRKYLPRRPKCSYMRNFEEMRAAKEKWRDYFERKKLELCPCSKTLDNLQVLLLETAPKGKGVSVFEYDIVEHYWQTWFDEMEVYAKIYPEEDQVAEIRQEVKRFLKRE